MTIVAPKTMHETEETGHPPTVIRRVIDRARELYCRKCKEHRKWRLLKGHAGKCPFGDCSCAKCRGVMSQRAKAIIRRYRNNSADCQLVLKPVRLGNGNTRLRVFPTHVEDIEGKSISISPPMKQKKDDTSESRKSANVVDAKSGRSDKTSNEDCSEVNDIEDSTNTRHISPNLATAIHHQDNSDSCDQPPAHNLYIRSAKCVQYLDGFIASLSAVELSIHHSAAAHHDNHATSDAEFLEHSEYLYICHGFRNVLRLHVRQTQTESESRH